MPESTKDTSGSIFDDLDEPTIRALQVRVALCPWCRPMDSLIGKHTPREWLDSILSDLSKALDDHERAAYWQGYKAAKDEILQEIVNRP